MERGKVISPMLSVSKVIGDPSEPEASAKSLVELFADASGSDPCLMTFILGSITMGFLLIFRANESANDVTPERARADQTVRTSALVHRSLPGNPRRRTHRTRRAQRLRQIDTAEIA